MKNTSFLTSSTDFTADDEITPINSPLSGYYSEFVDINEITGQDENNKSNDEVEDNNNSDSSNIIY